MTDQQEEKVVQGGAGADAATHETVDAEVSGDGNAAGASTDTEGKGSPQDAAAEEGWDRGTEDSKIETGAKADSDDGPSEEDALAAARAETKRVRDQMIRLAADFDNYRKRAIRESQEASRRAKSEVLCELFPVFDNMERAVSFAENATDVQAVVAGVLMVMKQFSDTIGKLGVERVKAVGEVFDPTVHEAISMFETSHATPGTITTEVLGGYRWGDRLLRAAMVVVAKAPPAQTASQAEVAGDGERENSESVAKQG